MPQMEINDLHQKAVYWASDPDNGLDDFGNRKLTAAVEISVRWEIRRKEIVDSDGNTIVLESNAVVDQEIFVNSIVWLGALADIELTPVNLRRVVMYTEIPDVKNRIARRTIGMIKESDTLPELE